MKLYTTLLCTLIFFFPLHGYHFTVGSMFKDEAPYLKEWIEYHLMVGVEHFWLYNNDSTDNWRKVLAPYIEQGLVEVFDWPSSKSLASSHEPWPFTVQAEAFKDALRKAKGQTTWFSFIDIDEFFFPKEDRTIPECVNKHFSHASAIQVSWRSFGTNHLSIPLGSPLICKLTARSMQSHYKNTNGKTICRPEMVAIDDIYWVHTVPLLPGGIYINASGKEAIGDPTAAHWAWPPEEKFLRLNHYFFRDENFFTTRRIAMAQLGKGAYSVPQLWEYHRDFCAETDTSMETFIQTKYPMMYKTFWSKRSPNLRRIYYQEGY